MISAYLVAIWAAISVTVYLIEFSRFHLKIRLGGRLPFNRKPFSCEVCLPFWLFAAFLPVAIYSCYPVAALASACTTGIITPIIIKAIRK